MLEHKKYKQQKFQRIYLDIPLLKYPNWFDTQNASPALINMVEEALEFMRENVQKENYRETFEGFKPHEVLKLERNLAIMKEGKPAETLATNKLQFYQFVNEYDKRRKYYNYSFCCYSR